SARGRQRCARHPAPDARVEGPDLALRREIAGETADRVEDPALRADAEVVARRGQRRDRGPGAARDAVALDGARRLHDAAGVELALDGRVEVPRVPRVLSGPR